MKDMSFFIYTKDSAYRRTCARCGELPTIARRSDGKWIGFCPGCDLEYGFEGLNPEWFAGTKRDAIYLWSARQLVHDLFYGYPREVNDDYIESVLG